MTAQRTTFLASLRSQAEARARGVECQPLDLNGADSIDAVAELTDNAQAADDFGLLARWLVGSATRAVALDDSGENPRLGLLVSDVLTHSVELASGSPVVDSTTRAALVLDLGE